MNDDEEPFEVELEVELAFDRGVEAMRSLAVDICQQAAVDRRSAKFAGEQIFMVGAPSDPEA